jgi:PKD repeat protein
LKFNINFTMKKSLLYAASIIFAAAAVSKAQNVQPCATYGAQEYFIKTIPGYKEQVKAAEAEIAKNFAKYKENKALNKTAFTPAKSYTIPVVFHILHTGQSIGSVPNLNESVFINAINQVNRDFQRKGADTTDIDPLYEPLYINSRIHFALAKKDPMGNCTNGIVRHYNPNTQWTQTNLYNYIYSTIGTSNWLPSSYMNVYIVDAIIPAGEVAGGGTIVGYTYIPGTSPNIGSDAIVYDANFLSGINSIRSLSHEIGHWLGLSHPFGGSNNAGVICGNDDIDDTPATAGYYSTCPDYLTLNDSCAPGTRPNMQNIMDYSGCPKMFSQGQVEKMHSVLESSVAKRDSLVGVANLIKTGLLNNTSPVTCAPIADFWANKTNVCSGQVANYVNTSYNSNPTSFAWTFEGGSPSTSTLAAPSVTYSNPGKYAVSLTVTNASGTSTITREEFMNSSWNADDTSFPYSESFENGLPAKWNIVNPNYASVAWSTALYGSQGTEKCLILPNANASFGFSDTRSHVDILETPQFNFSNTSALSLSYDYSFARKPGVTGDQFKFEYSLDCGGTWTALSGNASTAANQMATSGGTMTVPYIPNAANKWVTRSYNATTLNALNNKRDVKFRFWFQNDPSMGDAQNLYIDEFKISGTVGLNELENELGLAIYPNPTSSTSLVEFTTPATSRVLVSVIDVTGRTIEAETINTNSGETVKHTVNKSGALRSGIYFVTINVNNQQITKKLIIE